MSRTIEVDTKTFIRFWFVIIAFAGLGYLIFKAASGLIIIFISAFLALALRPLAKLIDKIDKKKERPGLSAIIAVLVVVLGFSTIVAVVGPMIVSQVSIFLASAPQKISESQLVASVPSVPSSQISFLLSSSLSSLCLKAQP